MSNINLCCCEENWIEIKNKKNNLYLLSSKGRLYSYNRCRFIGSNNNDNYIHITGFFATKLHRLVYRYFNQINIEKYDRNFNEIDHINTIRNHNCICNLRCGTHTDNMNNIITMKKIKNSDKSYMKGKYKKNKKASLGIRKIGKKKYIIRYYHKGIQYNLYFYTEEEQKEAELLVNELYKDNILL